MWLEYFSQYMEMVFPRFLSEGPRNYENDLCVIGTAFQTDAADNPYWNRYILNTGKWLVDGDGRVAGQKEGENNIDKVSFGKSLWILRDLTGDGRYGHRVEKTYVFFEHYPQTATGNFWYKDAHPNQVWLDGLCMAMHFYVRCLAEDSEDRWNDIMDQFRSTHCLLWDEKAGLHLHGCDVSRKAGRADLVTGRSSGVWLRAEGWFPMALVDVYRLAKDYTPRVEELALLLKNGLSSLLQYQDRESYIFLQVVDHVDLPGSYPETLGSVMTACALMKGARLGMLGDPYWDKGNRIPEGIRRTRLKKEEDGQHLRGICASASLGIGPGPHNRKGCNGTPECYISEAQMTDNQYDAAAYMATVSERLRRKGNHSRSHQDYAFMTRKNCPLKNLSLLCEKKLKRAERESREGAPKLILYIYSRIRYNANEQFKLPVAKMGLFFESSIF